MVKVFKKLYGVDTNVSNGEKGFAKLVTTTVVGYLTFESPNSFTQIGRAHV